MLVRATNRRWRLVECCVRLSTHTCEKQLQITGVTECRVVLQIAQVAIFHPHLVVVPGGLLETLNTVKGLIALLIMLRGTDAGIFVM